MGTYYLANELGCCLCGSADTLPACNAATGCSDGYSQKIFAENIPCSNITATTACPTWHNLTPVSVVGNFTLTEIATGHCFCLGLTDDEGTGSATRTHEMQSTAVTINGTLIEFTCTDEQTESGICDGNDVSSGVTGTVTYGFQISAIELCCTSTPGICTSGMFSMAKNPTELVIAGGTGFYSVAGECLTEKGYTSCVDNVLCFEDSECAMTSYTPNISANFTVIIQNRYGATIASKQIFPQQFICPIWRSESCCSCIGDFDFNYSFDWTLSGTAIFKIGNE